MGSPEEIQRPKRVIPTGTTSWRPPLRSAPVMARADARETSCSPLRPPKTTITRANTPPLLSRGSDDGPILAEATRGLPAFGLQPQNVGPFPERAGHELYVLVEV